MSQEGDPVETHRRAFRSWSGGFDFARVIENITPTAIVGAVVIFANVWVSQIMSQRQIDEVRSSIQMTNHQVSRLEEKVSSQSDKLTVQNEKLIALNAQVAAYLGQQTQLNAAIDARMTYIERGQSAARR